MTIAGRMDAFDLTEISLCAAGAQTPAKAVIAKRQVQGASDTDADLVAKAMIERGADYLRSPEDDEDPPPELGPGESINWAKTAAAHADEFVTMAKARAKADGCSYEQAYAKVMNDHPRAARRIMLG
jgi:hypothetical protein